MRPDNEFQPIQYFQAKCPPSLMSYGRDTVIHAGTVQYAVTLSVIAHWQLVAYISIRIYNIQHEYMSTLTIRTVR